MYVLYHTQEQLKPTRSRPNLQRDAFLAHAMHLVVVKRVWQTTGSIKVAASCRHGIYFVDGNLREAWRVVGGLTPICKACPLRRAWFCCEYICCSLALSSTAWCRAHDSMVFITITCSVARYSDYIRGARDLDRNLPNIPGTIESIRAVLCPPIFTGDLFVLNRKLCLYLY